MEVSIGSIVLYTLTRRDAEAINRSRAADSEIAERNKESTTHANFGLIGLQGRVGNKVQEGDAFPMVVTRVWPPSRVNGQVMLDGTDSLWAVGVQEGTEPDTWRWPERG